MLDPRFVTDNLAEVKAGLARRGFTDEATLDRLATLAQARRAAIAETDALREERNRESDAMAKVADKRSPEFAAKRESLRALGDRIKAAEEAARAGEAELDELLLTLPNLPASSTPDGRSEHDNVELRVHGTRPELAFTPRDHVDLGEALGILDFERGTKLSGARFVVLRGMGARLERALMQFMMDVHADEHGYEEVWVPALVKDSALRGTGQLPKFEKDLFRIAKDADWEKESEASGHELYLIPTAEVPVTNLHADEILEGDTLPRAYCAYTPCFRSEAGSHGRDTRGMIRQHQFDKVELVRFVAPEQAEAELEKLTSHAESILQRLGLHYRVVQLCAGDIGFGSQKTYDLEVWLPSQDTFREISSCSWFGDFQARRLKARYRPAPKEKPRLLHTLNGSGLAIGRTLVALLEQYQQADGSVLIPPALRPYMGGRERLVPGKLT
ncbi:MAG: serine--tRNA ligase [Myxococcales bacterium]|nr:serine--tRNA ligase [Myxococcales bacterium]MCB9628564.1 serine--tRNA ligase [Sandaracinaceae bacterium]